MNHLCESNQAESLYRLSEAAEHYPREEGYFEVRYNQIAKSFTSLVSAFLFYLRLEVPSTLWDLTEGDCLIERKIRLLSGEMAAAAY